MSQRNDFPYRGSLDSATDGYSVSPSDSNDLPNVPRGLWVGVGGNISLAMPSGNITLVGVPAGTLLPVRPLRVRSTGTTASSIVALV